MKKLFIVESPTKVKNLSQYLDDSYIVTSSVGHIRDLSTKGKYGFGVDVDNNFKPEYVSMKGKSKVINQLKKLAKQVDLVYIGTDDDREGEAIAWHIYEVLGLTDDQYKRVKYGEINKKTVLEGIEKASKIDMDYVHSQEARRILDRIIGFRLSKLIRQKTGGQSAGRVQSVALKLIVDREREIDAFKSEEYWTITANFTDFSADLQKYKNKKIELTDEASADKVLANLNETFLIDSIDQKESSKKSPMPLITSGMQQLASSKLGFSPKKTMMVAQKLYEGIDIGSDTVGLITYMRTDSYRLGDEFTTNVFQYINKTYGAGYVGAKKIVKKKDGVQDAHEAIRPTDVLRTPESIERYLSKDEFKLYNLIYKRTLASLMSNAKVNKTTINLNNNDYLFVASGQVLLFDGYLKVYSQFEDSKDKLLPSLSGNSVQTTDVVKEQHFTKPPARYSEAKLIQALEDLGIGRPGTYASISDTLKKRLYIEIIEKRLHPTQMGIESSDKLQEGFSDIINVEYTANMEQDLDLIAEHKKIWHEVVRQFYNDFMPKVDDAYQNMEKVVEETGEDCPECGSKMIFKTSKYGRFEACSNFPECKYIKPKEVVKNIIMPCPKCDGNIVSKTTRRGKVFYGCDNYPKCKVASWDEPTKELCPECGNLLVTKKDQIHCIECDYQK